MFDCPALSLFDRIIVLADNASGEVNARMCTVGGPVDIDIPPDRLKGKDYRCKECGERFKGVGKRPMCPSCQSEDVEED
jgi:hypothetical protein